MTATRTRDTALYHLIVYYQSKTYLCEVLLAHHMFSRLDVLHGILGDCNAFTLTATLGFSDIRLVLLCSTEGLEVSITLVKKKSQNLVIIIDHAHMTSWTMSLSHQCKHVVS